MKIRSILKKIILILFHPLWHLEKLIRRRNNMWVFGAWNGIKYSDNSKYLFEYVIQHNPEIKVCWLTKNKAIYNELKKKKMNVGMIYSLKGVYWTLFSRWCFLTSGVSDVNQYCINGINQVWLWHGMPLKKIICDDESYTNRTKKQILLEKYIYPFMKFKPYCTISSSPFFDNILAQAFNLPKEKVWKTGLPRCDIFFSNNKDPLIDKIHKEYPDSKVLLFMPTFRRTSNLKGDVYSPFKSQYGYNEKQLIDFLNKNNIVLLYKPHFVDSDFNDCFSIPRVKFLNDDMYDDLYLLLNSIDGLITDYSSVFFDFVPLKKDIYLFVFDYKDYLAKSRGHYFNMFDEMDGKYCYSWLDFYKAFDKDMEKKQNIKFAEYLDGNSSEKIVKQIFDEN